MINFVDLKTNKNKRIKFCLNQIYGLGYKVSDIIVNDLCIGKNIRLKDLDQTSHIHIYQWIDSNNFIVDDKLSRITKKKFFSK